MAMNPRPGSRPNDSGRNDPRDDLPSGPRRQLRPATTADAPGASTSDKTQATARMEDFGNKTAIGPAPSRDGARAEKPSGSLPDKTMIGPAPEPSEARRKTGAQPERELVVVRGRSTREDRTPASSAEPPSDRRLKPDSTRVDSIPARAPGLGLEPLPGERDTAPIPSLGRDPTSALGGDRPSHDPLRPLPQRGRPEPNAPREKSDSRPLDTPRRTTGPQWAQRPRSDPAEMRDAMRRPSREAIPAADLGPRSPAFPDATRPMPAPSGTPPGRPARRLSREAIPVAPAAMPQDPGLPGEASTRLLPGSDNGGPAAAHEARGEARKGSDRFGVSDPRAGASAEDAEVESRPLAANAPLVSDSDNGRRVVAVVMVLGATLAAGIVYQVATSVGDEPDVAELRLLYPYGFTGAHGPRGELAPGAGQVEFELLGEAPCRAGSSEPCLQYRYSSGSFSGTMLVKSSSLGWQLGSDEGMPFRAASERR